MVPMPRALPWATPTDGPPRPNNASVGVSFDDPFDLHMLEIKINVKGECKK